jgi:hypothetical protein
MKKTNKDKTPVCGTLFLDGEIDQEFATTRGMIPASVRQDIKEFKAQGFKTRVKLFLSWEHMDESNECNDR